MTDRISQLILPQSTMCYGLYMIGYADKDFMATWAKYTEVELGEFFLLLLFDSYTYIVILHYYTETLKHYST